MMYNDCIHCQYFENIYDGYGMCCEEAIPVLVIDNYKPTDKFIQCSKRKRETAKRILAGMQYGQMAYQKEDINENSI